MRIAIASGKGGTGKTTVATALAVAVAARGEPTTYADFDAEEPNGRILLRPRIDSSEPVDVPVPIVDAAKCTLCGRCAQECRYGAIACLPKQVLVFPEICHGCGVCSLVCPVGAVSEGRRTIGKIDAGWAGNVAFLEGELSVGEVTPVPIIRSLRRRLPDAGVVIMDAPPGTTCPVVETLRAADYVILVTEPTPFGLSDLRLAVATVESLSIPVAVVVNRCGIGDENAQAFCRSRGLPILAEIPNDRAVAESYSRGILPASCVPGFARAIEGIAAELLGGVVAERVS